MEVVLVFFIASKVNSFMEKRKVHISVKYLYLVIIKYL